MSGYNAEQRGALLLARTHLDALPPEARGELEQAVGPYLEYRRRIARFQEEHLAAFCAATCFAKGVSACCGREGILTFFADVVVNALLSPAAELDRLLAALDGDGGGTECVYLRESGCLWRLKPIVCEMFLCEAARAALQAGDGEPARRWELLRREEGRFTRPTQPVLFDDIEAQFLAAGLDSPLMYCHHSPGLLRLKVRHGVGGRPGSGRREPGA